VAVVGVLSQIVGGYFFDLSSLFTEHSTLLSKVVHNLKKKENDLIFLFLFKSCEQHLLYPVTLRFFSSEFLRQTSALGTKPFLGV
jgi:hypothetical protein